jgi:hypothetical protein
MKRTTISLSDELANALHREARRRRIPASAIARDALARHLGIADGAAPRQLPFASLGRSGYRTTAQDAEELLSVEWTGIARGR